MFYEGTSTKAKRELSCFIIKHEDIYVFYITTTLPCNNNNVYFYYTLTTGYKYNYTLGAYKGIQLAMYTGVRLTSQYI